MKNCPLECNPFRSYIIYNTYYIKYIFVSNEIHLDLIKSQENHKKLP